MTERLQGARMPANAFDVLGVSAAAGRLLHESDDRADAPLVVVFSYRLWQRLYGGTADTIGRNVRINSQSFTVVGVLPAQFPLPLRDVDVVTALAPDRDPLRNARSSANFLRLFGRLNSGTDLKQAQSELTSICGSLRQQFPVEYARKDAVLAVPLREVLVGDVRKSMLILMTTVTVVLTTALANIVSLALVRANSRRAELSMRIAIGASRLQLARQLTVEGCLLAGLGSGLGWFVASQGIDVLKTSAQAVIPRLGEVTLDDTVGVFVSAITAFVAALLTLAPLVASGDTRTGETARGTIGDRANHRLRNTMVVAEIAAALVLVLATIVLVQNLFRLQAVHPGFNPDGVFQARVSIPPAYRSPEDVSRFYERLSNRLAASPGVQRVGVISVAPLSGLVSTVPFSVAAQPTEARDRPSANLRVVSAEYFSVVGTRLLKGRQFSEADRSTTAPVALVSAALSDRVMSGRAVGQRLLIDDNNTGPRPIEIVGVVENVRQDALDLPPTLDVYVPLRQIHPDGVQLFRNNQFWMVKTDSEPGAFRTTFLANLRAVDPDAAVSGTGAMRQLVDAWLGPRRFNLALFSAFALTTVLLAVLGLYGLVSYAVSQRTREIGLRLAIGATKGDVQWMILRHAGVLGASGAAAGVAITGVARRFLAGTVEDVGISPAVMIGTVTILIGVVLMAAWLPARRAARIDPMLALKGS
jgi:predicted permease